MKAVLGVAIAMTLVSVSVANAEKPVEAQAGDLLPIFNIGFFPKALSKTEPTPIALHVSGNIGSNDGSLPPLLREFDLEADRNVAVDVTGVPVCGWARLQSRSTIQAKKSCEDSIVGKGEATVVAAYPENEPIPLTSELLIFNGGFRDGVTTLFIHAYFTVPTPRAAVATVKIKTVHNGRFGNRSVASIPAIIEGEGHLTSFDLTINKGILTAKCPDDRLKSHSEAIFDDGSIISEDAVRTCTPKA
ncbi:MAG TPA: hypothetical protein VHU86_01495 [Solirubrobacterales bacterium]|nr:hypothetical protein [Solirubrobacterales bacterium]